MSVDEELWLPVAGYGPVCARRYEVSSHGRVRTPDQVLTRSTGEYRKSGRILKQSTLPKGYKQVGLHFQEAGVAVTATVHHLVLQAFVGPRPPGLIACHGDGNPANNHVSNLRWDTPSANGRDTVAHGRHEKSLRTHCPRRHPLTEPNLVASRFRDRGHRVCLACSRATWQRRNLRLKGAEIDFPAVADAYYREITGIDLSSQVTS